MEPLEPVFSSARVSVGTSYRNRRMPAYRWRSMPPTDTPSASGKNENDEAWINEVMDCIQSICPEDHPGNPCTIFKVPSRICQLDRRPYQPAVAYLGPFGHQFLSPDSAMERHKWQCVWHLLSHHRSGEPARELLGKWLLELKKQDGNVRRCYSEEFPRIDAQGMALIMLLDGCFIIYLMIKMHWGQKIQKSTESRGWEVILNIEGKEKLPEYPTGEGLFTVDLVIHDLLKLENQIPFFIIQLLFEQLKTREGDEVDLVNLALKLFKGIHPQESESFKKKGKKSPSEFHHLLHLFYLSRIPSENPPSKLVKADPPQGASAFAPKWTPNATELERAGVKFKRKEPADSFLTITFEWRKMKITPLRCLLKKLCLMFRSGRMEIPPLEIYDYTGPLFRNLIAFEQCYYDTDMYFTIYALFMDSIIDQAEDVRLLHLKGILEHGLSNDQAVADLFNGLGSHIHFSWEMNYLANQIEEVNEFYGSKWHKWLAGLRRDYLGNPWAIISVLAAIFLLLLTVEQAIFSALSYFHSSTGGQI